MVSHWDGGTMLLPLAWYAHVGSVAASAGTVKEHAVMTAATEQVNFILSDAVNLGIEAKVGKMCGVVSKLKNEKRRLIAATWRVNN